MPIRNAIILTSALMLSTAFGQVSLTTAQIAKKVSPSVVVIEGKTDSGDDVLGSGFIVSKDGTIVTNLHVIRDMKTARVHIPGRPLAGGLSFDVKVFAVFVLATDEKRDLAIVKIPPDANGWIFRPDDLPVLDLGDSDTLTVGEPVVVVGSPRGLEGTVTAGILSSVRDSGEGFKVLQTDAAVNPGNSGGPLVNTKGQAIGVVSFKVRSADGLNFAIPVNYVRALLNSLHEPITLDQMRKSLRAASIPGPDSDKPSLKETLDWLKERLPLGATNYVEYYRDQTFAWNRQSTVWSFDSCTVEFGSVDNWVVTLATGQVVDSDLTMRYMVPLGRLTGVVVERHENSKYFVGGERWSYELSMFSNPNEIRRAVSNTIPSVPPVPTKTITTDRASLYFSEESIAQRAKSAFLHASDLCRSQVREPF